MRIDTILWRRLDGPARVVLYPQLCLAAGGHRSLPIPVLSLRRRMAATILDLLVGVRPSSGRQIEQRPTRLDSAHMSHVLTRVRRLEKQRGGPLQPDRPIRPSLEHGHDGLLLTIRALAMVVTLEGIVCGRQQSDVLPSFVARNRRNSLDRCFCDHGEVAAEPLEM